MAPRCVTSPSRSLPVSLALRLSLFNLFSVPVRSFPTPNNPAATVQRGAAGATVGSTLQTKTCSPHVRPCDILLSRRVSNVDQNRSSTGYNGVEPADGECHVSNTGSRVSYVLWRGSGGQPLQWHRFHPTTPGFIAALTANRVKSPWEHEDTTPVMTQVRERPLISHPSFCVFYLYPSNFVTGVVFYFIIRSFFSRFDRTLRSRQISLQTFRSVRSTLIIFLLLDECYS